MSACVICGMLDSEKPMVYKWTPWCCGLHRKAATSPIPECTNSNHDHESPDLPGHGMFCADCLRPLHFNFKSDNYFHDGDVECFLAGPDLDQCEFDRPKAKLKAEKKSAKRGSQAKK